MNDNEESPQKRPRVEPRQVIPPQSQSLENNIQMQQPTVPKTGEFWLKLALEFVKCRQYSDVRAMVESALKDPEIENVYKWNICIQVGAKAYEQSDYVDALVIFECARLVPEISDIKKGASYLSLSRCLRKLNNISEAIVYNLIALDCMAAASNDSRLKVNALSSLKALGSSQEMLMQLSILLTPGMSSVPLKDIWHAIVILARLNLV